MTTTLRSRPTLTLLAALAVAPFVLAANAPLARLRFAPAAGTSLTKTFEKKATLALEEQLIEGQSGASAPDVEMSMTMTQRVVVTDTYEALRDGGTARLVRSYDELAGDVSASQRMELLGQRSEREQNLRSKSVLAGKKVAFTWNAETKRHDLAFVPAEDDVAPLADLDEDMDLRVLLPDHEVAVGDAWDVPLDQFHRVLAPGGDVKLVPEATDDRSIRTSGSAPNLDRMLAQGLEGRVRATLAGTREVDGVLLAQITLDVDVHGDHDMTDAAKKAQEGSDAPEGVHVDKVEVAYGLEGKGELLWDVAGGHFRSFELSGQSSIRTSVRTQVDVNGKTREIVQRNTLGGTSSFTASAQ